MVKQLLITDVVTSMSRAEVLDDPSELVPSLKGRVVYLHVALKGYLTC